MKNPQPKFAYKKIALTVAFHDLFGPSVPKDLIEHYCNERCGSAITNFLMTHGFGGWFSMLTDGEDYGKKVAMFGYLPNGMKFVAYKSYPIMGIFVDSEYAMFYQQAADSLVWYPAISKVPSGDMDAMFDVVAFFNNLPTKRCWNRWTFRRNDALKLFPEKPTGETAKKSIRYSLWNLK